MIIFTSFLVFTETMCIVVFTILNILSFRISILSKLLLLFFIIFIIEDFIKKDNKYNSYYQLLGLQYYFGSTAINNCVKSIGALFYKYLFKTNNEIKIEKIKQKLSKNNNFFSLLIDCVESCRYFINREKCSEIS